MGGGGGGGELKEMSLGKGEYCCQARKGGQRGIQKEHPRRRKERPKKKKMKIKSSSYRRKGNKKCAKNSTRSDYGFAEKKKEGERN